MDFVFIANSWSAGEANPTSKHRIATELSRRGHRVLWVEGSGMRTPSLGSGSDRGRIVGKIARAMLGATRVACGGKGVKANIQCSVSGCAPDRRAEGTGVENEHPTSNIQRPTSKSERERQVADRTNRTVTALASLRSKFRVRCWMFDVRHLASRIGVSEEGGIWVVSPLFAPFPKQVVCRRFNGWLCRRVAARWSRRLGMRRPILVNYVPVLHDAMRGWSGLKVYHCVDRWDAFAMYDQAVMARGDEACCRMADKVIVSSMDLEVRCRRFNPNVRLIPHGVDHAHFAGALSATKTPVGLPDGKIVGFFGLLSEWLDQDLLLSLAARLPGAQIVLIGKADVNVDRLRGVPNLHLLGPRPFSELPSFIARFDVGIIPFVVNDLTRAVNPIKLREMLAGGCPVVSTHLPEVEAYAGSWVDVVDTADAFIACVRNRIATVPNTAQRREISMSVAGESWAAKVDGMLDWIGGE